ncbi:MAG: DHH family phosphoesterase [Thermaurantimonas sp.]
MPSLSDTMTAEANLLRDIIDSCENFVITTHIHPDGDAVGSSLALYQFLRNSNKQVHIFTPDSIPPSLHFLPHVEDCIPFDRQPSALADVIQGAEVLFCLDFNTLKRTGDSMAEVLKTFRGKKILIDHHLQPDPDFELSFSDVTFCSTSELLFAVLREAYPDISWLTASMAICLYTGILTDSGSFRFESVTPRTHRVIADLLEAGARHTDIHEALFDQNRPQRFKLMAAMLGHLTYPLQSVVYSWITEDEFNRSGAEKDDSEGFVNIGLSVRGIVVSALFREEGDRVRISFRSKGEVDVNQYARKHFNGGGHRNAAGGTWYGTLQQCISRFENTVGELV